MQHVIEIESQSASNVTKRNAMSSVFTAQNRKKRKNRESVLANQFWKPLSPVLRGEGLG
jgi:hypothetical protein